jgi:hypothetical protein
VRVATLNTNRTWPHRSVILAPGKNLLLNTHGEKCFMDIRADSARLGC